MSVDVKDPVAQPRPPAAAAGLTLLLLRVISALVLFEHATAQAWGVPNNPARPFGGAPAVLSRTWVASWLELIGGALIILGLFTRPTAFVLSGLMAFAYFLVHAPVNFFPIVNRGEPAVLLCFVFLYMSAAGAGPYSIDGLWSGRRDRAVRTQAD
jgi:putative oxidoreductase